MIRGRHGARRWVGRVAVLLLAVGGGPVAVASSAMAADPGVTVSSPSVVEGSGGSGTELVFTLTGQCAAVGWTCDLSYGTSDGTATAGDDYTAVSGRFTDLEADFTRTVAVPVTSDHAHESDETVVLTAQMFYRTGSGSQSPGAVTTTGTIVDDDPADSVVVSDVTHSEGDTGTTDFTFTVSGWCVPDQGSSCSVDYTTADGYAFPAGTDGPPPGSPDFAYAGQDYTTTAGSISDIDGAFSATVTVPVSGDHAKEDDEAFTLLAYLAPESGAGGAFGPFTGRGTIVNDDPEDSVVVSDVTEAEGDTGTTEFTFTLSGWCGPNQGFTCSIDYTTADGTAHAGEDYTTTTGSIPDLDGAFSETVSVPVMGDTAVEPDEAFTLVANLTLRSGGGVTTDPFTGTGTITNDDAPVPNAVTVSSPVITEGDSGTTALTFTVSGTCGAPAGVQCDLLYVTADGTARAPSDYTAASGEFSDVGRAFTRTVTVPVNGDTVVEPDETLELDVSLQQSSAGGGSAVAGAGGSGTITDDDVADSLTVSSPVVTEGGAGTTTAMTFTVSGTCHQPAGGRCQVSAASADGTAVRGRDYLGTSGTWYDAGKNFTIPVTVTVLGDAAFERDETVRMRVSLSHAAGGTTTRGIERVVNGLIRNDDPAQPKPTADLRIALAAPATAPPGKPFAVTLTVTDAGPAAATAVTADLRLPAGFSVVNAGGGRVTDAGRTVHLTRASLSAGKSTTWTVTLEAGPSVRGRQSLTAVTGSPAVTDPAPGNNTAERSVTIGTLPVR